MKGQRPTKPALLKDASKTQLEEALKKIQEQEKRLPAEVANPAWGGVVQGARDYAQKVADRAGDDVLSDHKEWIFEQVMKAVYGPNYWTWNNKLR